MSGNCLLPTHGLQHQLSHTFGNREYVGHAAFVAGPSIRIGPVPARIGKLLLMSPAEQKQHAHELVDRLDTGQLDAVVRLLEVMTDPVARSLANAPIEDEPISEEEIRAVEASKEWLRTHKGIPNEQVLAEFGLTSEDFERMGRTPLPSEKTDH